MEQIPITDQVRDRAKQLLRTGKVIYTNDPIEENRLRLSGVTPLVDALCDIFRFTPMRVKQLLFSANFRVVDAYRWMRHEKLRLHRPPVIYNPSRIEKRPASQRRLITRVTRAAFGAHRF